jgi:glucose-6-phosphate 1-dehydrogenase
MDHNEYLRRVKSYIKTPTKDMEQQLQEFTSICTYVSGQYDQDESFITLRKHLEELEQGRKETNRIFYMALPPSVFTTVSQHIKKNCYPTRGIARIIVRPYSVSRRVGVDILDFRSRSLLERTWKALASFKRLWNQTGARRRSSVSTIT